MNNNRLEPENNTEKNRVTVMSKNNNSIKGLFITRNSGFGRVINKVFVIFSVFLIVLCTGCSNTTGGREETSDTPHGDATGLQPAEGMPAVSSLLIENNITAGDMTVIVRASVNCPQLTLSEKAQSGAEEKINSALKTLAESFLARSGDHADIAGDNYAAALREGLDFNPYIYSGTYQVTYLSEKYVSVLCEFEEYIGGVHSEYDITGMTFDALTGERVKLSGLLATDEAGVSGYISGLFTALIEASPEDFYSDALNSVGGAVNNDYYYLTDTGAVFYLPAYTVSPYSTGIPTVSAAYGELNGWFGVNLSL